MSLMGPSFAAALDALDVPSYVIDAGGTVRWASRAGKALFGDHVGKRYVELVANEDLDRARERFAQRLLGGGAGTYEISAFDRAGRGITLRIHSAPIRNAGGIQGIFGIAVPIGAKATPATIQSDRPPTRRQIEILRLLAEGATTERIASELGIARETARNHIRGLLSRLRVHSRLEAVVEGRRRGLLRDSS